MFEAKPRSGPAAHGRRASPDPAPEQPRASKAVQIQRQVAQGQASDTATAAPSPVVAAPAAAGEHAGAEGSRGAWLTEDVTPPGVGQMRRAAFLATLRGAITAAVAQELRDPGAVAGCPWIEHWLGYYERQPASHVEQALLRFAPEARQATSAAAYIPLVVARVTASVRRWAATGEAAGAPPDAALRAPPDAPSEGPTVSRLADASGADPQRVAGTQNPRAIMTSLGRGSALDGGVRGEMEQAFGVSFAGVRVHTDAQAAAMSSHLSARAFTVGQHIAFAPQEYQPHTATGQAVLAHELAHTLQQRGQSGFRGGIGDQSLETNADQIAAHALGAHAEGASAPRAASGLQLQRCSFERAPTNLERATTVERAAWIQGALRRNLSGGPEEILRVFRMARADGTFIQLQRQVDMAAVLGRLDDWQTVQLGAIGPLADTSQQARLNERRARVIRDTSHDYSLSHGEVFTLYVLESAQNDDVDAILRWLAQDRRLSATIGQMPTARAALAQRGIDVTRYQDRSQGAGDIARGIGGTVTDILGSSELARSSRSFEYFGRRTSMPEAYQQAFQRVDEAMLRQALSPGNVALGTADYLSFGLVSAVKGVGVALYNIPRGVVDLAQGNLEEGTRELLPALLLVGTLVGVRISIRRANARAAATLEQILAALEPESQAALRTLLERLGPQRTLAAARMLQQDSRAVVLAQEFGVEGVEALVAANGDVAVAQRAIAVQRGLDAEAAALVQQRIAAGQRVVVNLGGTGAPHEPAGAINLNPNRIASRAGIPNLVRAPGELAGDVFPAGSVDRVVGYGLPHETIQWQSVAQGLRRAMRPGGTVELGLKWAHPGEIAKMRAAFSQAGFTVGESVADAVFFATR